MKTTNEPEKPLDSKQKYDIRRQETHAHPRPWIARDTKLKPPKDARPETLVEYMRKAMRLHGSGKLTSNGLNSTVNACRLLADINKNHMLDERLSALEKMTTRKK